MNPRRQWVLRIALTALVLLLLWNTVLVKPLRILVVFFHEIFHATAALISGGGVYRIVVTSYEAGTVTLQGGWPVLVYSAGYIGVAFLGGVLLLSGRSYPLKRLLYLLLGVFILVAAFLFVDNPFGWAYGLVAGLFFLLLFAKEFIFSAYITDLVGVMCVLYGFYDFLDFLVMDTGNDAAVLHEISGIPYPVIVLIWLLVSIIVTAFFLYFSLKSLPTGGLEAAADVRSLRLGSYSLFVGRMKGTEPGKLRIRRRSGITMAVYFTVFAVLVLSVLWASRYVLFRPWTSREWVSAAAVDGQILVLGGRDREGVVRDEVLLADPERRTIRTVAHLPSPRYGMTAVRSGAGVYAMGGYDGVRCSDEVLRIGGTGRVIRCSHRLPTPRAFGAGAAAGGRLFYLGGWDGQKVLAEVVEIDPEKGGSKVAGTLPSAREFACAAVVEGRIYLFGGSDRQGRYLDEIVLIEPEPFRVIPIGHLPAGIKRAAAAEIDGRIFHAGGWEGRGSKKVFVIEVDGSLIRVQGFAPLPWGVADGALTQLNDNLYLVGGAHHQIRRQLQVLRIDPAGGQMESILFRSPLMRWFPSP